LRLSPYIIKITQYPPACQKRGLVLKSTMGILDEILRQKRRRLDHAKSATPLKALKAKTADLALPSDFRAAIKRQNGIRLIAELKKATPSKGVIRPDFDPAEIALVYRAKADAVSVLTEEDFFMGAPEYIKTVKDVSGKPVLRKDFIFDEYQIYESRALGADAVLFIAGILGKAQAAEYLDLAFGLGLSVLFEVHDYKELELALRADAGIIGINNRDLKTMKVDINTTIALKKDIPGGKVVVSESGISKRDDVLILERAGVDGVLVGTAFMQARDIGAKIDELLGGGR